MNSQDKLATGRLMACNKFKYFRSALMALVPKKSEGLGTFGVTDDGVLLWDPKMVDQWSVEEIAAVLIHEVSHLLRKHGSRRDRLKIDPMLWNRAADAEINDDLYDARLKLPSFKNADGSVDRPIVPQTHKPKLPTGLTAEEYVRLLEKEDKKNGGGKGKPGPGNPDPHAACGWCGSGAGRPLPGEGDAKGNSKGRSEVQLEQVRRSVAEDVRREAAKGQGRVAAGWVRWAEGTLKPAKVRWQDKLGRLTRAAVAYKAGAVDYKFTHPSRRQAGLGYGPGVPILPALRAPVPKIAVVQDTSGSMGTEELSAGLPEVDAILKGVGGSVTFIACDAAVHTMQPVRHWKELLKLMKGGGGTDFCPAFEALEKKRNDRPDVVVFITDGYGSFPTKPPPFKVIWLLTGRGGHMKPEEIEKHFGEAIELEPE